MKALVTGAKGMLGTDLCRELRAQGYQVFASDLQEMDVRDPRRVNCVFGDTSPDLVFHLAALTDVDGCEREPDETYNTGCPER